MILKTKSDKRTWYYFEGDNVTVHEENLSNTNVNVYPDTLINLREGTKINVKQDCACGKEHNFGIVICVQKENRVIARILTNRSTYLMNDLGKTIDKLI